ncbi:MAG: SRPBCC family protein [Flavobacteriales bacterium]|nr:SRPBCC family protein [Flavobacteriales bacterium]
MLHVFKTSTRLPISIDEAWAFFSNPKNLKVITPEYMGFDITSQLYNDSMYNGMIITYKVRPVLNIPIRWMTEITHIHDRVFFVDEQRIGPYKIWHHQHHFKAIEGGVEMTDIIDYVVPFGFIGRFLEPILVRPKLNEIFSFRENKMKELFGLL